MSNEEKFKSSFLEALSINSEQFHENIEYNEVPEWDSIGHMTLIAALEETFNISFETDDIIDFSSYKKGKQILTDRYKVEF